MVKFSLPPPMFIPVVFTSKEYKDALEDRENGDYCIAEGDLVLECNEAGTHPITKLV